MIETFLITMAALFSGYTGIAPLPFPAYINMGEVAPAAKILNADKAEILWLARVIFSETKDEDEMTLVGWVVRNRVEAEYRGSTYKEVALSASQFSGLNPKDAQYEININLEHDSDYEKWMEALAVAHEVYFASDDGRPFSSDVRHFYSPVSVKETPKWAVDGKLNYEIPGTDGKPARFAFYSGVK